jgi:hypothetical protein
MEIWKPLRASHISTPPTAATASQLIRRLRYTNNPTGTKCRAGQEDAGGDVYYLGPGHRILWLYPDGAWYVSDGVSQELTLEAYLASAF